MTDANRDTPHSGLNGADVVVVHGTRLLGHLGLPFRGPRRRQAEATWTDDWELITALSHAGANVHPFTWPGWLTFKTHLAAQLRLRDKIEQLHRDRSPQDRLIVIAHSHGGNLALEALYGRKAARAIAEHAELLTLATPFRHVDRLEGDQPPDSFVALVRSIDAFLHKRVLPILAIAVTLIVAMLLPLIWLIDGVKPALTTVLLLVLMLPYTALYLASVRRYRRAVKQPPGPVLADFVHAIDANKVPPSARLRVVVTNADEASGLLAGARLVSATAARWTVRVVLLAQVATLIAGIPWFFGRCSESSTPGDVIETCGGPFAAWFTTSLVVVAVAMFVSVLLTLFSGLDGAYFVSSLGITHETTPAPDAIVSRIRTTSGLAHSGLYKEEAAVAQVLELLEVPLPALPARAD